MTTLRFSAGVHSCSYSDWEQEEKQVSGKGSEFSFGEFKVP